MQLLASLSLLFIAQLCVGINIVLSKGLVEHINPLLLLTVRFTVASVFMAGLVLARRSGEFSAVLRMDFKSWLILLAEGIGAGVAFNFIMLHGLRYTDANSAGLITSLLPAVIIVQNLIFFQQKLTGKMLKSVGLSILGLILINLGKNSFGALNPLLGNFLVFVALIPDSLYYVFCKLYPVKLPAIGQVLLLNAVNLPILYASLLFMPDIGLQMIGMHDWLLMIVIGITSALFFVFWQAGIKRIDATYAALSTAFMPLATVILAWLILGEGIGVVKIMGMILVIASIVVYARR